MSHFLDRAAARLGIYLDSNESANQRFLVQTRIVFAFQLAYGITWLIYVLLYAVIGSYICSALCLFGFFSTLLGLILLRSGGSALSAGLPPNIGSAIALLFIALMTGGADSAVIVWLPIVVIGSYLQLGARAGHGICAFVVLLMILIGWMDSYTGSRFYDLPFPEGTVGFLIYNDIMATIILALIASIFVQEFRAGYRILQDAETRALAAGEAKILFLAKMSHEIRTPMNAIIGFSELGLDESNPAQQREYFRTIYRSSHGLLGIINDILDFSKIESGGIALDVHPFNLHKTLHELLDSMTPVARSNGLSLHLKIADGTPNHVFGDALRLRQVLTNLLSNAIKFSSSGTITTVVSPQPSSTGELLLNFSVTDQGIGISPEQMELLFEPFSQLDGSTTRKYGGTGLGLAISRQMVHLMGGEIKVSSQPGVGSTFSFTIATQEERDVAAVEEAPDPKQQALHNFSTMKVLIVEDTKTNQLLLKKLLAKIGVEVSLVDHGREAVEYLRQGHRPDLVFMDIQMPEMDGHEATRIIRNELKLTKLPIIALTAHAMSEERENCLASGMNDILTKPFVSAQIHEVLALYAQ